MFLINQDYSLNKSVVFAPKNLPAFLLININCSKITKLWLQPMIAFGAKESILQLYQTKQKDKLLQLVVVFCESVLNCQIH